MRSVYFCNWMNKKKIVIQEVVLGLMLSLLAILFFDFSTAASKVNHNDVYCCEVAESEADAEWNQDFDFHFLADGFYQRSAELLNLVPDVEVCVSEFRGVKSALVSVPLYVKNHQFKFHLLA